MPQYRVPEAARLHSVSDDTVRRWMDAGTLTAAADGARFAKARDADTEDPSQVELQRGGCRVVSLMSTEAVREMGLAPGVLAVAVIKSTQVIVETPRRHP